MLVNTLFLAASSSLDAFGIGITYGLRRTKISILSRLILFVVSFVMTSLSVFLGNIIKQILPAKFTIFLGSFLIIGMGCYVIYQSFKEEKTFDLDNSNDIDCKESLYLSLSLTMDSLCIGIGGSILGISNYLFPIFVATLHLVFLLLGNIVGKNLISISHLPGNIWSRISGMLLLIIGICKLL